MFHVTYKKGLSLNVTLVCLFFLNGLWPFLFLLKQTWKGMNFHSSTIRTAQEIPTLNLLDPTLSKSEIIHRLYYVTIMAIAPISATRLSETRTWSHSYRCLFHARIICILLWDSLSIIIIIIALRFTHMINIIIIIITPTPIMTPRQIMAPTTADNSSSVPLRASVEGGPPGGRYHNILNFLYVVFKASSLSDKALKREKIL